MCEFAVQPTSFILTHSYFMDQTQVASSPRATRASFQEQALSNIRALPVLLSVITLALGLIYLAVIPPWGGPDEPRHYEYVRLLHEKNRLVSWADIDPQVMNEVIRSMDAVDYWAWGVSVWKRTAPGELPKNFEAIYPGGPHQLHQPPLAYLVYLAPFKLVAASPIRTQLYAMRLVSILLNIVTVLAAYVAGRELFRDDPTMALAIPVFVMLLPQHLFLHSTVMNDHLVEAALAWMIALMTRSFRLGLSIPRVLGMLVLLGIGLASKRNALYGVAILGFGFLAYVLARWGGGAFGKTKKYSLCRDGHCLVARGGGNLLVVELDWLERTASCGLHYATLFVFAVGTISVSIR